MLLAGSRLTGGGISRLGCVNSRDEGGDSACWDVGLCGDVVGGSGVGVLVIGALAEAVCFVFFFFLVTGTGIGS